MNVAVEFLLVYIYTAGTKGWTSAEIKKDQNFVLISELFMFFSASIDIPKPIYEK